MSLALAKGPGELIFGLFAGLSSLEEHQALTLISAIGV